MKAVVTTGQGGLDVLDYRDVPVPSPGPGEVLLQVLAAGVNNTEINTRLGWYSASVTVDTASTAAAEDGAAGAQRRGRRGRRSCRRLALTRPTAAGASRRRSRSSRAPTAAGASSRSGAAATRASSAAAPSCGRACGRWASASMETIWMASDFDGAFAQFVKAPASEVFAVESDLSDAELGAVPCSYGTAENMLRRAGVAAGQHVLVTGASGGVGSAAVQLARRRGAVVTAVTSRAKAEQVLALGADRVVAREDGIAAESRRAVRRTWSSTTSPGRTSATCWAALRRGGGTSLRARSPARSSTLRQADLLPQRPDPDRLHGVGRAGVPGPHRRTSRPGSSGRPSRRRSLSSGSPPRRREFLRKAHVGAFVLIPPPRG